MMKGKLNTKYEHLINMTPLLIQVELTEACNLKCCFCYNSQKPRYNKHVIEILETLAAQGVMQVTLTGGESLLHPDFFSILEKAIDLFPNVMILSNGTLMDEKVVARLHNYPILSISISIHGQPELHDMLTGVPGSYERSIRAIRDFLERDKIPIASNFVLNSLNIHQLSDTIEMFSKIGLEFLTITRFIPVGVGARAKNLALSKEQLVEAFKIVDKYRKQNLKPHIEVAEATPFCVLPEHLRYLANTCSYGYDRFYVDVQGELMVCGLSRIPLGGNVLEKSIQEIKETSEVFKIFMLNEHVPTVCRSCSLFDKCHGGCRAAAMSVKGKWQATPDCHMVGNIQ